MSSSRPLVSIIIVDYKKDNPFLKQSLAAIDKQTYAHFEIILVTDYPVKLTHPKLRKKSYGHYLGPAQKRDAGAKLARGSILSFLDDDAYPSPGWLQAIVDNFADPKVAAVGGPGVTPPDSSWDKQASGWASASPLGSGSYTYRFLPGKKRLVDDYPSMNLSVRKSDFNKVKGFDSHYYPGEDTKLCLDLTHKLGKVIVYEPKALVYHHRRSLLIPHLKQNGNYGLHRGFFARVLPKTSLRPLYFLPSLMALGLIFLLFSPLYTHPLLVLVTQIGHTLLGFYIAALCLNALWILNRSRQPLQAFLSLPVIFLTHFWYGLRFLQGFLFTRKLSR